MVTGISHNLNPIKFDTEIPLANRAISDIRPGFKLKPQKNQHFPITILTGIINVLCVACRILPGSNAPFCLRLSDYEVVQHSSSRKLPRATASQGLNTSDPAMNLGQSQSPLSWYCGRERQLLSGRKWGTLQRRQPRENLIIWIC